MSSKPHVTDYDRYIRTAELLALQKAPEELSTHDELLFQMTHQVCELWMKLTLHELRHVCTLLDEDRLDECTVILRRVHAILLRLMDAFPLLEFILPIDFHRIRGGLGHGSGSESPGFRALLVVPRDIWPHVASMMERQGVTFIEVLREPRKHQTVNAVMQGLLDYDELFQKIRYIHFALTRRVLGTNVLSLKSIPVTTLTPGGSEPMFPELWTAIDALTLETKRE